MIYRTFIVLVISTSVAFAQQSDQVGSTTGRRRKQTTKPASFRKAGTRDSVSPIRSRRLVTDESAVLSIKTVASQPGGNGTVHVIVTLSKPVDRLWIYVHSADLADGEVPTIRHAKRVPVTALRKAGITGLKGNFPRYLCPIPKSDLRKLKGEALFSITFASTKLPRSEVSSCWYYHLATNTSTKVVDVPSEPKTATSPTKGQAARALKGS